MCNNNNAHTPQQLEYDHVVLTETFIRLASVKVNDTFVNVQQQQRSHTSATSV